MTVSDKTSALQLLEQHQSELRGFGVKRCGVFGSLARNEADVSSDIDILVEFDPEQKTFANFMELAFFLEELFGRPVDLVTTESLSPYIGSYILREVEYATIDT